MRKQKQNIMSSQNQSMLVSERKPMQNLIKTNIKCDCMNTLKNIQTKIQLFQLRLQQISANVNICFTKHLQYYGKLVDEQKKRQNVEYTIWDMKQVNQAIQQKISNQLTKQQQSMSNLNEQVQSWTRVLREMKNWKNGYTNLSASLQKNMMDLFKTQKNQNDEKLKKMYQAVQEIGLLQRKMIEKTENTAQMQQRKSRAISYNERQSVASKKNYINSHNQSTIMYGSRHCYK